MQQILKLCLETTVQWDIDTRKDRIVLALQNWLSDRFLSESEQIVAHCKTDKNCPPKGVVLRF